MKRVIAALAVAFGLAVTPMAAAQQEAKGAVHKATGVVTKVDKDKVTIRHEAVPTLKWPAMTMAFVVKDKAVIDRMKKDQKVDFEFVQQGREYIVTAVK